MNEIQLSTWNAMTAQRDMVFLALFFFAATGLFIWRVYLAGRRLAQRLTAALAVLAYFSLLVVGVVELWRL
jgi:hypothetical protein